jgi:2-keto-4-pentenoate hydratase/2-oxohepta-3-ene-1,7-dioic acid hydratase in catechol pathway
MKKLRLADHDKEIPVRKIFCLGRNYAGHAREMGADLPKHPVVFLKPATALAGDGDDVIIPTISKELHHEVELVVVIGKGGKGIPPEQAREHIAGYAVGLDMTLRDVQAEAKRNGLPWTVAKGFDTSAPVSTVVPAGRVKDAGQLDITLKVNGVIRQKGNTRDMIFTIDQVVSFLSSIFTLEEGDVIFTGTPEGVGPAAPGDILEAELESVGTLRVGVKRQPA